MESKNTLHWMHISDFHRGQADTDRPWPVVRQQIHDDIARQVDSNGQIDLVVFSGDLAFKGSSSEFAEVKDELERMWSLFDRLGSSPYLFLVPGNHDLVRPEDDSNLLNFADVLREKEPIRRKLLGTEQSPLRAEVEDAFVNYTKFVRDLKGKAIRVAVDVDGLFPGDASGVIHVNGLRVGLVGLNTAWTHLAKGDLEGKLDLYVDQLGSVVGNDLPVWAMSNHINFLVTHHPASWLNSKARVEFDTEIFLSKYFDAHLYGHMHETAPELSQIGAHARKQIQVASLFGLEKFKDEIDRRHGYLFAKVDAAVERCTVWPRKLEVKKGGGGWQVRSDSELLNGDELSCEIAWPIRNVTGYEIKKS